MCQHGHIFSQRPQQQVASRVYILSTAKSRAAKQQLQALLMQNNQHQQHSSSFDALKAAVCANRVVVGGSQHQLSVPLSQQQPGGGSQAWQQQQQQLAALKLQQQHQPTAHEQLELLAEHGSGLSCHQQRRQLQAAAPLASQQSGTCSGCTWKLRSLDAVRAWQALVMQQQQGEAARAAAAAAPAVAACGRLSWPKHLLWPRVRSLAQATAGQCRRRRQQWQLCSLPLP